MPATERERESLPECGSPLSQPSLSLSDSRNSLATRLDKAAQRQSGSEVKRLRGKALPLVPSLWCAGVRARIKGGSGRSTQRCGRNGSTLVESAAADAECSKSGRVLSGNKGCSLPRHRPRLLRARKHLRCGLVRSAIGLQQPAWHWNKLGRASTRVPDQMDGVSVRSCALFRFLSSAFG